MDATAKALGMQLVPLRAVDGPGAVRVLHREAHSLHGVWLAADLDVLTPQLFEYALMLEALSGIPVVAVTRQQVGAGAFLAVDGDPQAIAARAVAMVNGLIDGGPGAAPAAQPAPVEVSVNGEVARRLGAQLDGLRAIGARVW
jgi:hypothetical protein